MGYAKRMLESVSPQNGVPWGVAENSGLHTYMVHAHALLQTDIFIEPKASGTLSAAMELIRQKTDCTFKYVHKYIYVN